MAAIGKIHLQVYFFGLYTVFKNRTFYKKIYISGLFLKKISYRGNPEPVFRQKSPEAVYGPSPLSQCALGPQSHHCFPWSNIRSLWLELLQDSYQVFVINEPSVLKTKFTEDSE